MGLKETHTIPVNEAKQTLDRNEQEGNFTQLLVWLRDHRGLAAYRAPPTHHSTNLSYIQEKGTTSIRDTLITGTQKF